MSIDAQTDSETPTDCIQCGVCCFSELKQYVAVTGEDYGRFSDDDAERFVDFDGVRAFMRMEGGHCAALGYETGEFLCAVYADRPSICRVLERGSPGCAGEIATKGDRPLIAIEDLRRNSQ